MPNKSYIVESIDDLKPICNLLYNSNQSLPLLVLMNGELGSGKTTFVQTFCKELGFTGKVNSPTFAKVHEYQCGEINIFHLDIYRELPIYEELEEILFEEKAIVVIEWANKLNESKELKEIYNLQDRNVYELTFKIISDSKREIEINRKN
ncbi:MAG: tRNA (adenosine(37)-N6)-threonylcarbamoyltransferase complex ATPase subunit type 1 TsaE [Candidatus Caenarcaniphilales bacterium]|nr:tRNA (adenosine(37)-N6)-threonylcarbamoyltransferase complex ATPase subunit type 1 TsaE [Candidatus Caenarcaniphilales bacterium]